MKFLFVLLMLCSPAVGAEPLDGVTLDAYSHDGVLALTLNGACDYEVKLVEVFLKNSPAKITQTSPDTWVVLTEETRGIFRAIICTDSLCIPVDIDFNTLPWDGKVPDLAPKQAGSGDWFYFAACFFGGLSVLFFVYAVYLLFNLPAK